MKNMNGNDAPSDYRRRLRLPIAGSVLLFAAGILLGVIAQSYAPHAAGYLNRNIAGFVDIFQGLSKLELAAAIFLNNAVKAFLVIIGGVVLGIVPVVFLLGNGAAVGFLFAASIHSRGLPTMLLAVLPHGIFEIPAILLASSLGLLLGSSVAGKLSRAGNPHIRGDLRFALGSFARIVVPLLIIAAFVEAFVTSALLKP